MVTVGIDIGGRRHVAARCREGEPRADRQVVAISQDRAGFRALDAWLAGQPEHVERVVMESSGHYWLPLASHLQRGGVSVSVVNPLAAKYFAKSRLAGPSRTRPMPVSSPRWPCVIRCPSATPSPVSSCARRPASR
jgi:transposase